MKPTARLKHSEAHDEATTQAHQQNVRQNAAEFAHAEELIRHDAARTPVPPGVADRLRASLATEPVKPTAWWRRLLGRK
jgi:hypothetical protein